MDRGTMTERLVGQTRTEGTGQTRTERKDGQRDWDRQIERQRD